MLEIYRLAHEHMKHWFTRNTMQHIFSSLTYWHVNAFLALTSLPSLAVLYIDFTFGLFFCKMEKMEIKNILRLSTLLELCQFQAFWEQILKEPSLVNGITVKELPGNSCV